MKLEGDQEENEPNDNHWEGSFDSRDVGSWGITNILNQLRELGSKTDTERKDAGEELSVIGQSH